MLALVCAARAVDAVEPERGAAGREAKRLSDLGIAEYVSGDYVAALEHFEQSYAKVPAPSLLFNIGRVLSELGRDLDALVAFERFLAASPNATDDAHGFATAKVLVLQQRVAHLAIRTSVAGAEILVDGMPLGRAPLAAAVRVVPGTHQVMARAAGYATALAALDARAGAHVDVELRLLPAGVNTTPLRKRWWFWTALGGAAAVAATGIGLAVRFGTPGPPTPDARVSPQTTAGLTGSR